MTTQPPDLKKLREVRDRLREIANRDEAKAITVRTDDLKALLDAYEAIARDAERYRTFVEMIDPDKVPGGFTLYYAIEEGTDQLIYFSDLAEILDAARHATQGD